LSCECNPEGFSGFPGCKLLLTSTDLPATTTRTVTKTCKPQRAVERVREQGYQQFVRIAVAMVKLSALSTHCAPFALGAPAARCKPSGYHRYCNPQNFLIILFSYSFHYSLRYAPFSGSSCGGGRKLFTGQQYFTIYLPDFTHSRTIATAIHRIF
jgi:hypothetical protein